MVDIVWRSVWHCLVLDIFLDSFFFIFFINVCVCVFEGIEIWYCKIDKMLII